jgi:hypothetical protein
MQVEYIRETLWVLEYQSCGCGLMANEGKQQIEDGWLLAARSGEFSRCPDLNAISGAFLKCIVSVVVTPVTVLLVAVQHN